MGVNSADDWILLYGQMFGADWQPLSMLLHADGQHLDGGLATVTPAQGRIFLDGRLGSTSAESALVIVAGRTFPLAKAIAAIIGARLSANLARFRPQVARPGTPAHALVLVAGVAEMTVGVAGETFAAIGA